MQIVPVPRLAIQPPAAPAMAAPQAALARPGVPNVPSLGTALKQAFEYESTRVSAYDAILASGRPPYDAQPIVSALRNFEYDSTRLEALRAALGSPLSGPELGWFMDRIGGGFEYDSTRLSAVQLVSASTLPGRHLASIVETAIDMGEYDSTRLELIRKGVDAGAGRG